MALYQKGSLLLDPKIDRSKGVVRIDDEAGVLSMAEVRCCLRLIEAEESHGRRGSTCLRNFSPDVKNSSEVQSQKWFEQHVIAAAKLAAENVNRMKDETRESAQGLTLGSPRRWVGGTGSCASPFPGIVGLEPGRAVAGSYL